jgi:hypothetical protein
MDYVPLPDNRSKQSVWVVTPSGEQQLDINPQSFHTLGDRPEPLRYSQYDGTERHLSRGYVP